MNIAAMIGPVDVYSSFVAVVIAGVTGIVATALAIKWQNRQAMQYDFDGKKYQIDSQERTAKYHDDQETARQIAKYHAERDVQIRRIDTGLIEGNGVRMNPAE